MAASKGERLAEFLERLRKAPPASSAEEAVKLVNAVLDDVEDRFSGIAYDPAAAMQLVTDGRMYGPHPSFASAWPRPGVTRYAHARHDTFRGRRRRDLDPDPAPAERAPVQARGRREGARAMNAIERLHTALRKRLPKADAELVRPRDPQGRWLLEVERDGWIAAVVWVPRRGFGLTAGPVDEEAAYGENADQLYPGDADGLADELVTLLRKKRRTSPPRSVALKELRARYRFTQAQLAKRLRVEQGTISKLERSERLDVGTLAEVVKAMGGELEVWVRFPDDAPVKLAPPATRSKRRAP